MNPRIRYLGTHYNLIAAALLLILATGAAMAAPAGTVVGLSGPCSVEHNGKRHALTLGKPVYLSDTVSVPSNGRLKLRMQDGSVISIAAKSQLKIAQYQVNASGERENAHLSLIKGLIRAIVTHFDHPAEFEVDTAVGTAAVRSTDWFVEALPKSMQVGVLKGSVRLTSAATGRSATVPARWGARVETGLDPVPPRLWSRAEFDSVIARTNVP